MKKGIEPTMLEKFNRMFLKVTASGGAEYGGPLVGNISYQGRDDEATDHVEEVESSDDESEEDNFVPNSVDRETKTNKRKIDDLSFWLIQISKKNTKFYFKLYLQNHRFVLLREEEE